MGTPVKRQRLIYVPLEPYAARYTEYTSGPGGMYETAFREAGVKFTALRPETPATASISGTAVVNPLSRMEYSFAQMRMLGDILASGTVGAETAIFFEDFWTFGMEAVPYLLASYRGDKSKPSIYSFCHAQTVDPYDFTRPWRQWMRPFELAWINAHDKVFCAAPEMIDMWRGEEGTVADRFVAVGHAWKKIVLDRTLLADTSPVSISQRHGVVFASRIAPEKNPEFFMKVAARFPSVPFYVVTAVQEDALSPYQISVLGTRRPTNVTVLYGASKRQYYQQLRDAKVLLNCSHQDFISYVLLDALACGCTPLFPNHMTFPAALNRSASFLYGTPSAKNDEDARYVAFDTATFTDCVEKLHELLNRAPLSPPVHVMDKYEFSIARMLFHMGFTIPTPPVLIY